MLAKAQIISKKLSAVYDNASICDGFVGDLSLRDAIALGVLFRLRLHTHDMEAAGDLSLRDAIALGVLFRLRLHTRAILKLECALTAV